MMREQIDMLDMVDKEAFYHLRCALPNDIVLQKTDFFVMWLINKIGWAFIEEVVPHELYAINGHATGSYHYHGQAADFHIKTDKPLLDQIRLLEKTLSVLGLNGHCGLGVYPFWNDPGFHLDTRSKRSFWVFDGKEYRYGEEARSWLRIHFDVTVIELFDEGV